MTARIALTAVYEPVEQGWVQARLAELPAVITAAPTLDAARELLADALREYLLSLAESPSTAAGQNGAAHCKPLESSLATPRQPVSHPSLRRKRQSRNSEAPGFRLAPE